MTHNPAANLVTTHLNARIPQELHQRLKRYAKDNQAQQTVILIMAITDFLDRAEREPKTGP